MVPLSKRRRGAAAVEMAFVAPIIFLLFLAAFEFSRLNMIRHTAEVAAFEGARRGIVPGATVAAVQSRVHAVLAAVGVDTATVEIEPATPQPRRRHNHGAGDRCFGQSHVGAGPLRGRQNGQPLLHPQPRTVLTRRPPCVGEDQAVALKTSISTTVRSPTKLSEKQPSLGAVMPRQRS